MNEDKPELNKAEVAQMIKDAVAEGLTHRHIEEPTEKNHFVRPQEKYCSDCGTKNASYKPAKKLCEDCESPNSDDAIRCWNCGNEEFNEEEED